MEARPELVEGGPRRSCAWNPPRAMARGADPDFLPQAGQHQFHHGFQGHHALRAHARLQRLRLGVPDRSRCLGWWTAPCRISSEPRTSPTRSRRSGWRRPASSDGFLSDVSFGVNYADRTKAKEQFQSNLMLPGEHLACGRAGAVPHRHRRHRVLRQSARHDRLRRAGHVPRTTSGRPINSVDDPNANDNDRVNNVQNTWQVDEKLTTALREVGHRHASSASLPLRGNIGVQAIQADQTSHLHITSSVIPANTPVCPITSRRARAPSTPTCLPEPEPGTRVPARHEAALRRSHHGGASAPG